jgi:hypothetical protein
VAFVDQQQVAIAKTVDGHLLDLLFVCQLRDFRQQRHIEGILTARDQVAFLAQWLRVKTILAQLTFVLLGQAFVRRQHNDPAECIGLAGRPRMLSKLQQIHMHEQRLATACGVL